MRHLYEVTAFFEKRLFEPVIVSLIFTPTPFVTLVFKASDMGRNTYQDAWLSKCLSYIKHQNLFWHNVTKGVGVCLILFKVVSLNYEQ